MAVQLRDGGKGYRNPYGLAPVARPAGGPAAVPGPVVSMAPAVEAGGTMLATAEPATGRTLVLVFLAAVAVYFLVRDG